jgi:hypothetical protein
MQTLTNQVLTAQSSNRSEAEAVRELRDRFKGFTPTLITYFASSSYDQERLNTEMRQAFGTAALFGCSTSGELVTGKMLQNSIVAMAFDARTIEDVQVQVIEHLSRGVQVEPAFKAFEAHTRVPMADLDFTRHVGLVVVDGLSVAEEAVMDRIGDLTNVTFIGGSAGDDLQFKRTYVYANGRAYTDAAALALLKPAKGFEILKTQSFQALDKVLVVTDTDEATRTVRSFNGKPAVEAYAEAVGKPVQDAPSYFMTHPLGLMANGEIFVRSPQQVKGTDMVFYCQMVNGMELRVLESQDIVKDTRAALEAKLAEVGPVAGMINFHCILRTLELQQKSQEAAYGQVFAEVPTVGFSTYGEQYIGHINQTSTILLLK